MSSKSSRFRYLHRPFEDCPVTETQALFLDIASPYRPEGGVKQFLNVLAMRTSFGFGRVRGLYHGKARLRGDELLHLQRLRPGRGAEGAAPYAASGGAERGTGTVVIDREQIIKLERGQAELAATLDRVLAELARLNAERRSGV